jgi:predicted DCC family thiol-disulfide oxidoreductase YuxK
VERLFYDGACGLCHWLVRFTASRDKEARFRFAPLGGKTFAQCLLPAQAARLPDSLVVQTAGGDFYVRSDAVVYVLSRLGGFWAFAGALLRRVPRRWRDWAYDCIARLRGRLFRRPADLCPRLPPDLRDRFEA